MRAAKELLPIGSIVLLQKGLKKAMVVGILQSIVDEDRKITDYDYIGVLYPEGFFDVKSMFFFNHEQINDTIFRGYENPERTVFLEKLQESMNRVMELGSLHMEEQK